MNLDDVHDEHIYADAKQAEENDSLEASDLLPLAMYAHKDDPDDHDCHASPEDGCGGCDE